MLSGTLPDRLLSLLLILIALLQQLLLLLLLLLAVVVVIVETRKNVTLLTIAIQFSMMQYIVKQAKIYAKKERDNLKWTIEWIKLKIKRN